MTQLVNTTSTRNMLKHKSLSAIELHQKIKQNSIVYGGNIKLKIYGTLHCKSGKQMKKENRVFFTSIDDVLFHKFRPCGHCMRTEYKKWKDGLI
ncbi:MAG: Ada metal-binding domain-containing protein [Cellulophaga sp.]